jgi:hypothetical protein
MRNPIYTGWRVYTQRRDTSSGGIRTRSDGRQADRRKIARAPEDIIRVRVLEPAISENDFRRLQQIMDLKKKNHWRTRADYEKRFTYGGFLRCGECGNRVYTQGQQGRDWYVCKSRKVRSEGACSNPYMRRGPLEQCIDRLFTEKLTDGTFLEQLAAEYTRRTRFNIPKPKTQPIEHELEQLKEKKQRIMDAYFENLIDRNERNQRLHTLDIDGKIYRELLMRAQPQVQVPTAFATELAEIFAVFHEWEFLGISDKRKLLRSTMPEIHVQNYQVVGLSLVPGPMSSDEVNHTGRDSWRRQA